MDIVFRTRKLERTFNSEKELQKVYGAYMARTIQSRLTVLGAADTLAEARGRPALRLHQLTGRRMGQFSVDLVHPYRMVLIPNHDPVPVRNDGGIDTTQVTSITIIEWGKRNDYSHQSVQSRLCRPPWMGTGRRA